jgi:hypothetical protein
MTPQMEFTQRCAAAAADLALLYAGEPEEKVLAALSETRQNIAAELAETFGAEGAALFAAKFVETVIGRRRELLHSASSVISHA